MAPHHSPPTKLLLICQACGHESPLDGDWVRTTDDGRVRYGCPACGHTLTERPNDC